MHTLIAKIAAGQKTSKDLTWEEAKRAMRALIEREATPAQVGAFLAAMRWKGESVSELAAFTATAREYVPPLSIATSRPVIDLPLYAGKQETFHVSVAAAIVAAAAGVAVLLHGHDSAAERSGVPGVLAALGVPVDLSPAQVADAVGTKGVGYLDLALYHPPLARFLDLRAELGVRTVIHPVVKLLNPARAKAQLIGVTHPPYLEKTAEAVKMLGGKRALIVRGVDGEPELSIASATRLLDVTDDRVVPLLLQPKDLGLAAGTARDMAHIPAGPAEEAALLRRIIQNDARGGARDWVVQNAALLIYAAGLSNTIAAAVPIAARTIDSGAAREKLTALATAPSEIAQGIR